MTIEIMKIDSDLCNSSKFALTADFRASADGQLLRAVAGNTPLWVLELRGGSPYIYGGTVQEIRLDIEDAVALTDGTWHSIAIMCGAYGSKIFIDGYQCFSGTASLAFGEMLMNSAADADVQLQIEKSAGISVENLELFGEELAVEEIIARALPPQSLIDFAATELSAYDACLLKKYRSGSVFLRYRVRGPGQEGPILAASGGGKQQLQLVLSDAGLEYSVLVSNGQRRQFFAAGKWNDGEWHDVVLRVARGAVDIYVDGYQEAHIPGQTFFADVDSLDSVIIGQDFSGWKLFGEVRNASIYDFPLTDGQIQRLSGVKPLSTQCLFDYGYHGAASYRIPSLLMTQNGVLIAGADQREVNPNDAPNSINFTIRRSLDGGKSWKDLETILQYPGEGITGASVIDSCLVQDRDTGRIFVFIDQYPGGVGQPNGGLGKGVTDQGEYLLKDNNGQDFIWKADGSVTTLEGETTEYQISANGDVFSGGEARGNVFLCNGEDPQQSLLIHRTSFLIYTYSDDDGETWAPPININHLVKEEWMAFLGTSPGSGIQIRHGKYQGRLVIPVYFNTKHQQSFSSAVIYSDDHGLTWHRGKSPNDNRIFDGEVLQVQEFNNRLAATHESTIVERADGSILVMLRNQDPHRLVEYAVSTDGGESWGEISFAQGVPEIFCQPHMIAIPSKRYPDRVLFANAAQLLPYRGRGVLRISLDGGESWSISRTFNPYHYVYQCLTRIDENRVGLLWERETQGLYYTEIPLSWFGETDFVSELDHALA